MGPARSYDTWEHQQRFNTKCQVICYGEITKETPQICERRGTEQTIESTLAHRPPSVQTYLGKHTLSEGRILSHTGQGCR